MVSEVVIAVITDFLVSVVITARPVQALAFTKR